MSIIDNELETIKKKLRGCRDKQIRSRCEFIIECQSSGNIILTAKRYGHSRQSYYRWLNRLRDADYDLEALRDKSRAPKTNPRQVCARIVELAIATRGDEGLDAPTVSYLLWREHKIKVAASTLGYIFQRRGLTQTYRKPRPNTHTKRYAKERPLEQVQTDTTGVGIVDNNGHKVYAYPVVDDCSRAVTVHVADEHSGNEATKAMQKFVEQFGIPENAQTDHGSEFTYNHLSDVKISEFDQLLQSMNINHVLITPRTPQLNGKVERFNRTMKRHLRHKLRDGMTIAKIQAVVEAYVDWYNRVRYHRSLNGLTPHEKFFTPSIARLAS